MTKENALKALYNGINDLRSADFNTYTRPLKRIARELKSDDLKFVTNELKGKVDLDAFISGANKGGSFAGSKSLNWPSEREEELGLSILIIERSAEDSNWLMTFVHDYYYAKSPTDSIRKMVDSVFVPFYRDFTEYLNMLEQNVDNNQIPATNLKSVFIVHGHDDGMKATVARFVENLGLKPVILHEQVDSGQTIIEKLESNSNIVDYAIVLLSPDDIGRRKSEDVSADKPRARQNVILELGYFIGKLGRDKVVTLVKDKVEIPTDYDGVIYTPYDDNHGWMTELAKEMKAAGYKIDMNKVI